MQATTASLAQTPREALIRDMFALASYLMRNSNLGAFNAIAELDLSFTQIKALCTMDIDASEPSVKGLAESMKVSLPAMSRAVDGLYERGFVDRYEDPVDRRMKRIRLTDSGRVVTGTLNEARLIGMREFLTSLNGREAKALARALELILAEHPEIAALRPAEAEIAELPASDVTPRSMTPEEGAAIAAPPAAARKGATP
jgi:DNA-binding MarR family transcriptional regulator